MPVGESREHTRGIPDWEDTEFQPRVAGKQFCFACRHFRIVQCTESQLAVTVTSLSLSLSPPGCDLPQNTDGPCRIHRKGLSCQGCHHLSGMTELPTASKACHAPTTATTNVARQGLPKARELFWDSGKATPVVGWSSRAARHTQPPPAPPRRQAALFTSSPLKFRRKTPYGERRKRPEPSRALRVSPSFLTEPNRSRNGPARPSPAGTRDPPALRAGRPGDTTRRAGDTHPRAGTLTHRAAAGTLSHRAAVGDTLRAAAGDTQSPCGRGGLTQRAGHSLTVWGHSP